MPTEPELLAAIRQDPGADGPILAYRKQYARFYQFDDAEPAVAAA